MGNMAKQLQELQAQMMKEQAALETEVFEVTAGGGMVTISITGHQRVQSITLKKEIVDPEDLEMLQDLLTAAVNQAIEHSQTEAAKRLDGLAGGMNIPGFGGGGFG